MKCQLLHHSNIQKNLNNTFWHQLLNQYCQHTPRHGWTGNTSARPRASALPQNWSRLSSRHDGTPLKSSSASSFIFHHRYIFFCKRKTPVTETKFHGFHLKTSKFHGFSIQNQSSLWFQPIWKICSSNWVHLPQFFGVKIKNLWVTTHLVQSPVPQVVISLVENGTPKVAG